MAGVYRPRHPERTVLYRVLFHYFDQFLAEYESRFEREYGYLRSIIKEVVERYLDCGNPRCGFARIRCPSCGEERFVLFSCRSRGFCPSCHAKRIEEWGEWMREELLLDVPHRQVVFTVPKMLRIFFKYKRRLLGDLCQAAVQALLKSAIRRSQKCWENSFFQMLVMVLREADVFACFLADRGFRRTSIITLLLKQTGHSFLVRLAENVSVQSKRGTRTLRRWGLQPGRAVDLGWVDLRQDAAVNIRVVGIWAKGHREPWWLATNRSDSLAQLAALYDRRMAVEEQIRDTKGARLGFALVWTQITTPESLARFVVLIGRAVLLLTAVGHALSLKQAHVRLPSKTKRPRLSLLTVGLLFWPVLQNKTVINLKFLKTHLPPPALRSFPWLDLYEKRN